MAGRCAEIQATVWLGGEVTPEEAFAVEADDSTAARALAHPVPKI